MHKTLLAALCLTLSVSAHASSTFRCEGKLVSVEDPTFVVSATCGEPISRAVTGSKLLRDEYGFSHEVSVEEWVYGPRNGMYHYLSFEGGLLKKIQSRRGQ